MAEEFGKYQLIEKIAQGGMAEVFLAKQSGEIGGFEKKLAIKRIFPNLASEKGMRDMFLDEARIAANLNHPNIVQVYDLGQVGEHLYIAMEYVDGYDFRRILEEGYEQGNDVPINLAVNVVANAAAGLHYAHTRTNAEGEPMQIVHRDMSPQNILITKEGHVKVCDFGIAKAEDRIGMTRAGEVKGKIAYMSPEQVRGSEELDHRSDIFALGIVLYESTTIRRLFRGDTDFDTMREVVDGEITPPRDVRAGYPADLEKLVMKALSRDPEDRFDTAEEMQLALEEWLVANGASTSPVHLSRYIKNLFSEEEASPRDDFSFADKTQVMEVDEEKLKEDSKVTSKMGTGVNSDEEDFESEVEDALASVSSEAGTAGTAGEVDEQESFDIRETGGVPAVASPSANAEATVGDLSDASEGSDAVVSSEGPEGEDEESKEKTDGARILASLPTPSLAKVKASRPELKAPGSLAETSEPGPALTGSSITEPESEVPEVDKPEHKVEAAPTTGPPAKVAAPGPGRSGPHGAPPPAARSGPHAGPPAGARPPAGKGPGGPRPASATTRAPSPSSGGGLEPDGPLDVAEEWKPDTGGKAIKLILGAVGVVAVLVLIAVGTWTQDSELIADAERTNIDPDALTIDAVDPLPTVDVAVSANQEDVKWVVNGHLQQPNGGTLELLEGRRNEIIAYKEGFAPAVKKVDGAAGVSPNPLELLPFESEESAALSIVSEPRDAKIFIDGVMRGTTPTTIQGLAAEYEHHIEIVKEDRFGYAGFIRLEPGKEAVIETTLHREDSPRRNYVEVIMDASPRGLSVEIDGELAGGTPFVKNFDRKSAIEITFDGPDHAPMTRQLHLVDVSTFELRPKLRDDKRERGKVTITVDPPGPTLYLGPNSFGQGPAVEVEFPEGKAKVVLDADFDRGEAVVDVLPNRTTEYVVELRDGEVIVK